MRSSSQNLFMCSECDGRMERVDDVPVLQSLQGHAIHRCGSCGYILLVQEERDPGWNAGWLGTLPTDCAAIGCASRV